MGNNRIYLTDWSIDGDRVKLVYSDEDIVYVSKVDFDRAGMDFCDYSFHINYLIAVFELH